MPTIASTEAGATGRYIDLGSPAAMDNIGAQTIIVYCKPASIPPSVFGYIYAKGTSGGYGPRVGINASGQLAFGAASSSGSSLNPSKFASSTLTASTWQHLQATWDGGLLASGIDLYVDAGSALANTPADGVTSVTSDAANNVFLMNRTGLGREFVGDLAYVAVWSGVLNSTQRANVRNNGPLSEPTGLKLLWANDQDYSTNAFTASARSTRVTGSTPTNTALGGADTAISASLSCVSTAVSALTTGISLACAAGANATVGASLQAGSALSASFGASCSASATLATGIALAASAGSTATVSASLGTPMALSGAYERSSFNPTGSSISGTGDSAIISIVPKVQESESGSFGTHWMEPSVDVSGVNGYRPTFRFLLYKTGADGLHAGTSAWYSTRRPMYSTDSGLTWTYFDTAVTLDTTNQWVEFRNSTAFASNTVRISRSRQITVHQVGDWVAAFAAAHSEFVPTASAVAFTPTGAVSGYAAQTFIADEFTAQTDSLSATIPVTPFYAGVINDTALMPLDGSAKRTALVSCGMHAGEDYAHWSFRGFMDYVMGSSTEAQALRRRYRILVYPMVNAPGRAGGGWRGSWTNGTGGADDTNRHYDNADGLDIVIKSKAAITTDLGSGAKDWAIDFHGTYFNSWEVICPYASAVETRFHSLQQTNSGKTIVNSISYNAGYMVSWLQDTMGVKFGTVMEHGDPVTYSDATIEAYGAAMVPTLATMAGEGAFDTFAANTSAKSTVTCSLTTGIPLSMAAGCQSTASAAFASAGAIAAQAKCQSSANCSLTTSVVLAAQAQCASVATAALLTSIRLSAAAACKSSVSAGLAINGSSVYPLPSQVLAGVLYGPTGADFTGTATGGSSPSAAEITASVMAALTATTIPVDMHKVKGQAITGTGSEVDPWGP